MKKLIIASVLLVGGLARAEFSSDVPGQAVKCQGPQFMVTINAKRTQITVADEMNDGHPEVYKVTNRNSDGDTYVSYYNSQVRMVMSDQGDTFEYQNDAGSRVAIQCPTEE